MEEVEDAVAQPMAEPRFPTIVNPAAATVFVVVVVCIRHQGLERPRRLLCRHAKLRQRAAPFDVVPDGEAPQGRDCEDPVRRSVDDHADFAAAPVSRLDGSPDM